MDPNALYPPGPVNRPMDAVLFYAEQEAAHRVQNPLSRRADPDVMDHLKKQYESILTRYAKTRELTPAERKTRSYIRHEVRRFRAKLQPTIARSIIHFRPVNWLLNSLLGRQENLREHDRLVSTIDKNTSTAYNIEQLHGQMAKVGFTGQIETALKRMIDLDVPSFSVRHIQPSVSDASFLLHFEKIPGRDVYYLKSFDAMPRHSFQSAITDDQNSPKINFPLNKSLSFSPAEAGNLTNGRPVQKELNGNPVWYMRDASGVPSLQQRPFDLDQALTDLKINGPINPSERTKLLRTLGSGGAAAVTLTARNGQVETYRIKVGYNADRLIFMDADGRYLDPKMIGVLQEKAVALSQELHQKQNQKLAMKEKPVRLH